MVTDDRSLADRVRAMGNYGSTKKYQHDYLGANSRMSELQAAVLRLKLSSLDSDNRRRREIAGRYRERMHNRNVEAPVQPPEPASHVWHIYAIESPHRAHLADHLESRGIQTAIHYPCVILRQPAYRGVFEDVRVPVSETLQHRVLSLPISPVMEDHEVDYVIESLNNWPGAA
jgi:dTDP-4-amino-4,6-dideoxygalactose transaminase